MTFYHTEQFTISKKKNLASDDILTYKELHAVQENVSNNILPYTAFQTIKKKLVIDYVLLILASMMFVVDKWQVTESLCGLNIERKIKIV